MPDRDPIIECQNCGKESFWGTEYVDNIRVKLMPDGWTRVANAYGNGTLLLFCSATPCESTFLQKHPESIDYPPSAYIKEDGAALPPPPPPVPYFTGKRTMCECGRGPFKNNALHGHRQSKVHIARMAAVAQAGSPIGTA